MVAASGRPPNPGNAHPTPSILCMGAPLLQDKATPRYYACSVRSRKHPLLVQGRGTGARPQRGKGSVEPPM